MIDAVEPSASCRVLVFAIAIGALGIHLAGCARPEKTMAAKTVADVLNEHAGQWMSIDGVVGTAEGLADGRPCIKVYVVKKTPDLERRIPRLVDGYPVVMEETGEFRALPGDRQ
jgi:hypothetical protein